MKPPFLLLSTPSRAFVDDFLARNPEIAFCIAMDIEQSYYVGFSLMLESGTVRQAGATAKDPEAALRVAYATLGMNFGVW